MRYIEQFTEGYRVSDVYLVKNRQIAVTRNGAAESIPWISELK